MSEEGGRREPPLTEDERHDPRVLRVAQEWLAARRALSTWVQELRPDLSLTACDTKAVLLISWLQRQTPSMVITFAAPAAEEGEA